MTVAALPKKPGQPVFKLLAQARVLRDLNVLGLIDQYSVAVGMQVLGRMREAKSTSVVITQKDIATTFVTYRDEMLAAPVPIDSVRFTRALQELHSVAALFNGLTATFMQHAGDGAHFTTDPRLAAPAFCDWTPIYFHGFTDSQAEVRDWISTTLTSEVQAENVQLHLD